MQVLVMMLRPGLAQELLQGDPVDVFNDDKDGVFVSATAQKADDILMRVHHFHHCKLVQEVTLVFFCCVGLQSFDGDNDGAVNACNIFNLTLVNLSETAFAKNAESPDLTPWNFPLFVFILF